MWLSCPDRLTVSVTNLSGTGLCVSPREDWNVQGLEVT